MEEDQISNAQVRSLINKPMHATLSLYASLFPLNKYASLYLSNKFCKQICGIINLVNRAMAALNLIECNKKRVKPNWMQ